MDEGITRIFDFAHGLQGEFHPDPEAVEAWQEGPDQSDNGEFRYGNKSPTELRRMIEVETDPVEREQMCKIMDQFIRRGLASDPDDPRLTSGGEPDRGDPRDVATPGSLTEMVKDRELVISDGVAGGRELPEALRSGEGLGMDEGPAGVWEET